MAGTTENQDEFLRANLRRPVVLTGMMGVGKTHIGRKLAERLGIPFRDSDKIVEERAGASINEIFTEYGEEKFRQAEQNAILEALSEGPCVLATGGGAVLNPGTRKAVKADSISVWLKLDVKDILKRVGKSDDRPLLRNGDPETTLNNLMKQREPFYREADIHLDTDAVNADKTIGILINSLYEHVKNG